LRNIKPSAADFAMRNRRLLALNSSHICDRQYFRLFVTRRASSALAVALIS
jgi:hypothetical protein